MRQGISLLYEAMVAEMRAARLDLYARTKFTPDGENIQESRAVIEELCGLEEDMTVRVSRSAELMSSAALLGDVEVG